MATFHGVGVNFGISSSLAAVTGLFQTRDHAYKSSNELLMDGTGNYAEKTYYGFVQEATFDYVAAGSATGSAAVTLPTVGNLLTVTDTQYAQIASTYWLVDDVSTKVSNTTAVRVSCKLSLYPNITA